MSSFPAEHGGGPSPFEACRLEVNPFVSQNRWQKGPKPSVLLLDAKSDRTEHKVLSLENTRF